MAEITDQSGERIVLGIYGPDNLIQRDDRFPGATAHLMDKFFRFVRRCFFTVGEGAQHADLSEAGAEVVMEVAGDAGALVLHFTLPLNALQSAPVSLALDQGNN